MKTAVELLRKELEQARKAERAAAEQAARLEAALAALEGDFKPHRHPEQLAGKGIVEASKILIKEMGPQKTGTLMREAQARGWTTTSEKPIAAFYSTLNGSKAFERIDDKWHLADERGAATRDDTL
jgi:hypothetical protein